MSNWKYNTSCKKCGSSDALAVYEDDTGYCFSCETYYKSIDYDTVNDQVYSQKRNHVLELEDINQLPIKAIPERGIKESSAKKYGVRVEFNEMNGEIIAHYYPVYVDGQHTGYKKRLTKNKQFTSIGNCKNSELFGQHLFGEGKKLLIITEGELDALSVFQMLKNNGKGYSVVSLSNGASSKSVKTNLEYVESFETVTLCFDQDEPGRKAIKEISNLLTPGKVKVMTFSEKDANDMLLAGKEAEFILALFNAKRYSPDGIIILSSIWDDLYRKDRIETVKYPWEGLNDKLYGARKGEIVTLTSGSGQGKSAVTRELEYWMLKNTEDNIGILALEENKERTALGLMAIDASLPLHIREERDKLGITKEDTRQYFDNTVGTGRVIAYDHFGSTSEENLIIQVRNLIRGFDCKWIFLDHLSIVVSSMEENGDERKTIDSIMTRLRTLVEETGAGLFLVSHLKRPIGDRGHEQGKEVSLSQLRGSHSIAQLSDAVVALERNQQAEDEKESNLTTVRVLKNRYAGLTGIATRLFYNRETGRLEEVLDLEGFLTDGSF